MRIRAMVVVTIAAGLALIGPGGAGASTVRPVHLPRDHGAHPSFSVEWWYTAGTVADRHGDPFFWFATIWSGGPGQVARVNVLDLRHDRVVLAKQFLLLRHPTAGEHRWDVAGFRLVYRSAEAREQWSI